MKKFFQEISQRIARAVGRLWHRLTPARLSLLVVVVMLVLTWGIGDANLWQQIVYSRRIHRLEKEYKTLYNQYQTDSLRLYRLTQDKDDLERIARTEYHMKAPDELLFLLVDSIAPNNTPQP